MFKPFVKKLAKKGAKAAPAKGNPFAKGKVAAKAKAKPKPKAKGKKAEVGMFSQLGGFPPMKKGGKKRKPFSLFG